MDILEELRALRRDLDELGDAVVVVLLERAQRSFLSWSMPVLDSRGIRGASLESPL